jgi:hypothetical protein
VKGFARAWVLGFASGTLLLIAIRTHGQIVIGLICALGISALAYREEKRRA